MTKFWALIILGFVGCQGCAPYFVAVGKDASSGAVDGLTTPDAEKKLAALTAAATKAARDEALGPATKEEVLSLLRSIDPELQTVIAHSGKTAGGQVEALLGPTLQARMKKVVRASIDEALGPATQAEVSALREELLGVPLQKDLDEAIDSASPHLAQAVAQAVTASLVPVQADIGKIQQSADAEAGKWKPVAIGFGIGTALLLACVALLGWVVRGHHKTIQAMRSEMARARG